MATTVPRIDSVSLDPNVGRQRSTADADAFGAASARAAQSVAQGLNTVARVADEKDQEFDEADAQNQLNALSARVRERLYNPDKGYLSTARGMDAANRRGDIESGLQTDLAEIAGTARSDRARALFQDAGSRFLQQSLNSIATHVATESRAARSGALEAFIAEARSAAVAANGDDNAVRGHVAAALGAVAQLAELNGWTPEQTTMQSREVQSGILQDTLVSLAATDPAAALARYEQIRPSLDAASAGALLTSMRAAQRQAEEEIVDNAWEYVAAGRSVPAEVWSRVPGRYRIDIQNEQRRRAESGSSVGNRALISDLTVQAISDPDAFARRDLREVRSQLGEAAYVRLASEQATIRQGGGTRSGISREMANGAMAMATRQMRAAGYDTSADADEEDVANVAEFQSDLIGLLDRFVEENQRAPNAAEQLGVIQNLLAQHTYSRTNSMFGGNVSARATDTYTPYSQIPPEDRAAIEARLASERQAVTRGNVERVYQLREIERLRRGDR